MNRKVIILTSKLSGIVGLSGWRQKDHLLKRMKGLYRYAQKSNNSFRRSKRRKEAKEKEMKNAYKKYVIESRSLLDRAKKTIEERVDYDISVIAFVYEIKRYIEHGERQIDQIIRRVLGGEKIPHEEKVFSIFEEHTEWISKGKAGIQQELGLNVCIVEDQFGFLLHHKVMEKIKDIEVTVPIVKETKEIYPDLTVTGFDKNFWSPENKKELDKILEETILPKKGKLRAEERENENREIYKYYRKKHSAVESGINALENHGLDRCCDHGIDGFKRYIALAILARNIQSLGNVVHRKEVEKMKKQEKLKFQKAV